MKETVSEEEESGMRYGVLGFKDNELVRFFWLVIKHVKKKS